MPNKLIKNNFDTAAKDYLSHAHMQKESALAICNALANLNPVGRILDLGSGSGTLLHSTQTKFDNELILVDLSINMLHQAKHNNYKINADATHLPIRNESISTIISNLMIQWLPDKQNTINEINRVLSPYGYCLLSTLIQPSLYELKNAWRTIDSKSHTLAFETVTDYQNLFNKSKSLSLIARAEWDITYYFPDIYALMRHFKQTGTSMPSSQATSGLGGKKLLVQLANAYEQQRTENGLPLTYYYLLIIAQKVKL